MKAFWLTPVGICTATLALAEAPNSVSFTASAPQKHLSDQRQTCQLGTDCLGMSKAPVTDCPITGKNAKANGPCAFDRMKLIGKFIDEPTFLL